MDSINTIIMNPENTSMMNPIVIIIVIAIIVICVISVVYLGNNHENIGTSGNIIGTIIIVVLVLLIISNAMLYFLNVNINAYIQGLFTPNTTVDIVVNEPTSYQPSAVPELKFRKQVFNIPGNYYSYDKAKALCTAYGAELASYDQIEKAYNNGAEWCNYGWSANQLALFPTQKTTYDNLQEIPGHQNDCGRTGINGGYIANPNVRFGVNCYGYKPKMTNEEEVLMQIQPAYPVTTEDILFQKEVNALKNNLDEILVSPFNQNTWSEL